MQAIMLTGVPLPTLEAAEQLPHRLRLAASENEFIHWLRTGHDFLAFVTEDMLTDPLCDALATTPTFVQIVVLSSALSFDNYRLFRRFHHPMLLEMSEVLYHPEVLLSQVMHQACDRFYQQFSAVVYRSLFSTDKEFTCQLRQMQPYWSDGSMVCALCRLPYGASQQMLRQVTESIIRVLNCLTIILPEEPSVFFLCPEALATQESMQPLLDDLSAQGIQGAAIGISSPVMEDSTIYACLSEAALALQIQFYEEQHISIYTPGIYGEQNDYVQLVGLEKQLSSAILSSFEEKELLHLIDAYIDYFAHMRLQPALVYDTVYRFLNSMDRIFKYIDPLCTISLISLSDIARYQSLASLKNAITELLLSFLRSSDHEKTGELPASNVQYYIDAHLSEPLSLESIADEFHVNKFLLCKQIKQQLGMTLWDYVVRARMEKAMDLLVHTQQRIYEIAQAVGFPDSTYFSTVFKHHTGLSPLEFRKQAR